MTRRLALELLSRILDDGRPLDEVLPRLPGMETLEPRDRAFVRHLVATTLRHLGGIDHLIDDRLARPLPANAARTRHVLRLGVCQLLYMRVPAHAVVNTAVALVGGRDRQRHGALVNAMLRRLSERAETEDLLPDRVRLDTAEWLWNGWSSFYGAEVCRAMATASQAEAPLDLTVKEPGVVADWAARLEARILPSGSLRLERMADPTTLDGFADGTWWVQDAAAALPARLFREVAGTSVLDMCAAPGGKTAQLAAAGARVTALDRSRPRMDRLRQNLERLSLDARLVVAAGESWSPEGMFDGILLDAPCSATGTLRRHPDIAWLKSPADVDRLIQVQRRLLVAALDMLRPGGTLVYCTCSLQPEEGETQMDWLLSGDRGVRLDAIAADELPGLEEAVTGTGMMRTRPDFWPELGGMDGFFAARLTKS